MPNDTAKQKVLGRGKYVELIEENGWEFVRRHASSGVVVILATTDAGEVVLVEQPRIPVGCRTIELPAGLVGDIRGSEDEPFELAARRELEEETGFRGARWSKVLETPGSAGLSSELMTYFRATGLTRVGSGGGDDTEDIVVHVVPLGEVAAFLTAKLAAGMLIDPKVFVGLYLVDGTWPPGAAAT